MVLLVFSTGGQRYALALATVQRVVAAVETTPLPDAPAGVLGVFDLHGVLVPVLDMAGRRSTQDIGIDDCFLILQSHRRTLALVVEAVEGVLDAPALALDEAEALAQPQAVRRSATRTAEGLVMIHDVERFLSDTQDAQLDQALQSFMEAPQ